jgi:hypothetical protein
LRGSRGKPPGSRYGTVINVRKPDPRTGKVYKSMYFRTLSFSCLKIFHDLLHKNKTKIVPLNIRDLLTPLSTKVESLLKREGGGGV